MNEIWFRFMAPVAPNTINSLFRCIDNAYTNGVDHIHLMISSTGGSVYHGITAHNYLKGIDKHVTTYNFGTSDSIATVLFCAGATRISVPHARFLIHPVTLSFNGPATLNEKDLAELKNSAMIDSENIARIISDTTGKPLVNVEADMHNRTTLTPIQANNYGDLKLVNEIKPGIYYGAEMYSIYENGDIFRYVPNPIPLMTQTNVPVTMYNMPPETQNKPA